MKRYDPRIIIGTLLLIAGGLGLLQTFGILESASTVFWGGLFTLAGLAFLTLLFGGHWWSAFPGFVLLALGVLTFLPDSLENIGGAIFLGGIALSFWVSYATSARERWWALIPAGVLTTLSVMTIAAERFSSFETAGFFFLGLALTFLLVALLAGMRWAFWPATVLGILGLINLISLFAAFDYVWAIALIAAGVFLLVRYFSNR